MLSISTLELALWHSNWFSGPLGDHLQPETMGPIYEIMALSYLLVFALAKTGLKEDYSFDLWKAIKKYLLIVQHDVGSPNVVGRHVQLFNSSIFIWIPDEFIIVPKLKETSLLNRSIFYRFVSSLTKYQASSSRANALLWHNGDTKTSKGCIRFFAKQSKNEKSLTLPAVAIRKGSSPWLSCLFMIITSLYFDF